MAMRWYHFLIVAVLVINSLVVSPSPPEGWAGLAGMVVGLLLAVWIGTLLWPSGDTDEKPPEAGESGA